MKNIVIIHHNDEDGFGGAWVAWKKFKDRATYIEAKHQTPLPAGLKDKEIYIIDFCFMAPVMEKLLKENKKIVVIDHHISTKEEIKISTEYIYGEKNSGAVLAWKYFYPKKPVPKLLSYVEDMDLWKFKKRFTKEVMAAVATYDFDFLAWNKLEKALENPKTEKKFIEEGRAILKYQDMAVKKLVSEGIGVTIGEKDAFSVNSPILQSQIGNYIYGKKGIIGLIWSITRGRVRVSLRSGGNIDVSKVAGKFGGGGHKYAAGFWFDYDGKFPWKPISKKVKGESKKKD